jgi:penicillin-binding protein 1C
LNFKSKLISKSYLLILHQIYYVLKNKIRFDFLVFILPFCFLILAESIFTLRVMPQYSTIINDSEGKLIHAFLNKEDKWRLPITEKEISGNLKKAILYKEDQWFYWHFGVNPLAITRAAFRNMSTGRRTSGASTISMQVVRLLNPKKRTFGNKIVEMIQAIRLELNYSKNEILQIYLSITPYGSNIEGIKSAAALYFQKSPEILSLAEIATLTIIPNRPSSLRLGENNSFILKERNKWLAGLKGKNIFGENEINDAIKEQLIAKRQNAPHLAPHFSIRMKNENSTEAIINTSLILQKQQKVEVITKNYVSRIMSLNIHNAAILVINNKTNKVEIYVGSADFKSNLDGGQVDGIQAVRSPGSTLKPLLYATAFDLGLLSPKTIINDVPSNFAGFEPENFDKQFHGKVTMEYALANSLNIPAVKTLQEVSTPLFVSQLKKADFKSVKNNASKLGLSLVLGGCGTTLEELTTLFSAFANNGIFIKPSFYKNNSYLKKETQLVSEEASYIITKTLNQVTRPDLPNNYDYTYRMPKIAWKTGTSFGKKDAWSIGYNAQYTVGVWVGNFSGEGVPELSGANIATPLLFEIFNTIDYNGAANWFKMPKNLTMRKICAESGLIPNHFCQNQILDYYKTGISNTKLCGHLKEVTINVSETISYCKLCQPNKDTKQKLYPNYAPELLAYYESRHILHENVPPPNPNCTRLFGDKPPKIVYPVDGSEYFLSKIEKQKLLLTCQVGSDVNVVNWYINDQFLQKAKASQSIFYIPTAGSNKISCTDDKGRNSDIMITVKY